MDRTDCIDKRSKRALLVAAAVALVASGCESPTSPRAPDASISTSCATATHKVSPPSWLHGTWQADIGPYPGLWRFTTDNVQAKFHITDSQWAVDLKHAFGSGLAYVGVIRDRSSSTKYSFVTCRVATGDVPEGWVEAHFERSSTDTIIVWQTSDLDVSDVAHTYRRISSD